MDPQIVNICYLIAAVMFILDLKWMAHPRTAVRGNRTGAIAMAIAVIATLLSKEHTLGAGLIAGGVAIGAAIGLFAALKVKMTSMPELVGLFNGFGGAASILVAGAALVAAMQAITGPDMQTKVATVASALIGSVTFFGSYVAFGKLAEFLAVKWKLYPWQKAIKYGFSAVVVAGAIAYIVTRGFNAYNGITLLGAITIAAILLMKKETFPGAGFAKLLYLVLSIGAAFVVVRDPGNEDAFWMLVSVAGALGVMLTWSIGGADMPVVIALLNSYSGLAAAATGFVINNTVLIISGSLVGASGIILTSIMCKAMNRSLLNVMFSRMGPTADTPDADEVYKNVKSTSGDEIAMMLETAQRVVIVPGYGMAVAQAQHAVRDLANLVEEKFGADVEYSIHPVAGRMPGHMNVLLAEADVSYDKLKEMDDTNSTIETVDVCIVVGANDVVNPVARTDPNSPIAGMPIIDVDKARTVIVIKRSLSPGFAGIPNPLFANDNTLMFFSDAKKAFVDMIEAVKES
ncbi:MAG: NAD(P)(+) transhydrogenase (Re/Si-specific) subunit beta [Planctomycetota bacterium]|jgi:NAD(P) transhydrogenase subunit beta